MNGRTVIHEQNFASAEATVDEADGRVLRSAEEAEEIIAAEAFDLHEPKFVGVELEWFVRAVGAPQESVAPERVRGLLDGVALDGNVSFEPGGQLELSSRPMPLASCIDICARDLTSLRNRLMEGELALTGEGYDRFRAAHDFSTSPRYAAMVAAFRRRNDAGDKMLFSTSSAQICLDAGDFCPTSDFRRRWEVANALAPLLIAAFANSPIVGGRSTGWCSNRQAQWLRIDPTRTAPPGRNPDPREAWARYALDANVICVRRAGSRPWTAPEGLTLRRWLEHRQPSAPTVGDLRYHLTTLFPPVRPRGHLELRMVDAQAGDGWIVPLLVAGAVLDDPAASDAIMDAITRLSAVAEGRDLDVLAARSGMRHPLLAEAVRACIAAAHSALAANPGTRPMAARVAQFAEAYSHRGRCPADDILDSYS